MEEAAYAKGKEKCGLEEKKNKISPATLFSFCSPVLLQRKSLTFSNPDVRFLGGREGQVQGNSIYPKGWNLFCFISL